MRRIPLQVLNIVLLAVLLAGATGTVFCQEYDCYALRRTNKVSIGIDPILQSSSDDKGRRHDPHGDGIRTFSGSIKVFKTVRGRYDLEFVDMDEDAAAELKFQFFHRKTQSITSNWLLGCEFHNFRR